MLFPGFSTFIFLLTISQAEASRVHRAIPSSTGAQPTRTSSNSADAQRTDLGAAVAATDDGEKHWLHPHVLPGELGPNHELTPHRLDIIVYKATEDDGDVKAGDFYIETSAAFRQKLSTIAQQAGCAKKKARDLSPRSSCNIGQAMRAAVQEGGPADIEIPDWPSDLTIVNEDVAATVAQYLPAATTPYASMVFVAGYALLAITGLEIYLHAVKTSLPKFWIGEPGFNVKGGPRQNPSPTPTPSPTSSSSSSTRSCPTGTDMPLCYNTKVCDGLKSTTCEAEGKYRSCTCLPFGTAITHPVDSDLLSVQDIIMSQITAGPPAPTPTESSSVFCYHGADAGCDQGRLPCEWCECTTTGKGWNNYSVNKGGGGGADLCPYTDHPGTKITWSSAKPTQTPVAKCNFDYCPVYYYGGLPRDTVIGAAEKYCTEHLTPNRQVVNNWPSGCHWDVGGDFDYAISFSASPAQNCHANKQVVLPTRCVAAMHHAVDDCNTQNAIKCGGTYTDINTCVTYHFHTEPKNASDPRCR